MELLRRYFDGGELEIRAKRQVSGSIPYRSKGMLSDGSNRGGRPLGEVIEPGAFNFRIETPSHDGGPKNIHVLKSHDFAEPLASTRAGSLSFKDTLNALTFVATIADTRAGDDTLELIRSGVAPGVSFGFRLPPKRRVDNAAVMEREPFILGEGDDAIRFDPTPGAPPADVRVVRSALLYEVSIGVARPVFPGAEAESRSEDVTTKPRGRPIWLL